MVFKNDAVKDIKLTDELINWIKNHKVTIVSSFMAVSLSTTLLACTPSESKQAEDTSVNNEQVIEEDVNEEQNTEENTSNKSAVITSINLVKKETKKLKELKETAVNSPEYEKGLKQSVSEFDALYRFIVLGETYEGTTFEQLPTNDKIKAIKGTMSIGEIIETVEPNYKEDIDNKKTDIYNFWSEFIDKYGSSIREKLVDGGAYLYNKGKDAYADAKDLWNDIKDEADKQR